MSKKGWHLLLVSRMITIADKEGWRQKNVQKRRLWVLRMWIKRTIDSNLTVYMLSKAIKHANWTLTNEYPPFYHVKKSTSKIVVQ